MRDPFLVDECLSPQLVAVALARGHYATHVVYRNLQGTKDRDLLPVILSEGFVFVTENGHDFLRLLGRQELHPGLIIIVHDGSKAEYQARLFGHALAAVEQMDDLVNKVVEVYRGGEVVIRDWPRTGS